jgi:hypothetical protein
MNQSEVLMELAGAIRENTDYLKSMKDAPMHLKTPASVNTSTLLHGATGIYNGPGLERDVISAHIRPYGIAGFLPRIGSVSTNPLFASLTGFTDVTGDEPTNSCDDAPAGYQKSCYLTARFGKVRRDSQTIEMDEVIEQYNRGDFTDIALRGRVLGLTSGMSPSELDTNQFLNIVTLAEMVGVGVQTERVLSQRYWTGSAALGQMPGLDNQIVTGQVDANSNVTCPALDSDVKSFGYSAVCGTDKSIVEYMGMMAYYLDTIAFGAGLEPVTWAVVMRPQLFHELSECWPCSYNTNKCAAVLTTNSQVNVMGDQMVAERDRMRRDMTIPINGKMYPVILDTGIFEHNNINNGNLLAGQYASSIYFVPLTIQGNFPVTYIEYKDYKASEPDARFLRGKADWWWTDGGLFSWALEQVKWCYKFSLKTEQRIVLRTPQLAGKIQHVMYEPLQHVREPYADSPYFYDGGVSARTSSTQYAVWT